MYLSGQGFFGGEGGFLYFWLDVDIYDLVHDEETVVGFCKQLTVYEIYV